MEIPEKKIGKFGFTNIKVTSYNYAILNREQMRSIYAKQLFNT